VNCKLHVGNLPSSATEMDLRAKFGRFGTVRSAIVVTDAETGRSKRFGFVEMASDAEARMAIDRLNMTQYEEKIMSVSQALAGE
jgi:RNA recognition motif-containing protein